MRTSADACMSARVHASECTHAQGYGGLVHSCTRARTMGACLTPTTPTTHERSPQLHVAPRGTEAAPAAKPTLELGEPRICKFADLHPSRSGLGVEPGGFACPSRHGRPFQFSEDVMQAKKQPQGCEPRPLESEHAAPRAGTMESAARHYRCPGSGAIGGTGVRGCGDGAEKLAATSNAPPRRAVMHGETRHVGELSKVGSYLAYGEQLLLASASLSRGSTARRNHPQSLENESGLILGGLTARQSDAAWPT